MILVDANNIEQEKYLNGTLDTPSIKGQNITITIDIELQKYAEEFILAP